MLYSVKFMRRQISHFQEQLSPHILRANISFMYSTKQFDYCTATPQVTSLIEYLSAVKYAEAIGLQYKDMYKGESHGNFKSAKRQKPRPYCVQLQAEQIISMGQKHVLCPIGLAMKIKMMKNDLKSDSTLQPYQPIKNFKVFN